MQSLTNAVSYSYYIWFFFCFFFRCIFAYDNQTRSYWILFFPPVHWCFLAVWYTTLVVSQCGVFRMLFISFKQSKYLGDYESIKILTMIAKLCKTLFFCVRRHSQSLLLSNPVRKPSWQCEQICLDATEKLQGSHWRAQCVGASAQTILNDSVFNACSICTCSYRL